MTLSTTAVALDSLRSLPDRQSLLLALKDLKNSVIGNTLKKVEAAGQDGLKEFLLSQLVNPQMADPVDIDILNETSVIIGAIANEGRITLRPLILARAPTSLLDLVRATSTSGLTALQQAKLLPSVLRALRNVMVSAADAVWGHAWGVAAELKLVGTGLVGPMEEDEVIGKGKGYSGRDGAWRQEAFLALKSICEPDNLDTLLAILRTQTNPQVLLPIYQMLARLVVLPSNRDALLQWKPAAERLDEQRAGPSNVRRDGVPVSVLLQSISGSTAELPFILQHLLAMITQPASAIRRAAPKPLEAALDLLAALVQGQPIIFAVLKSWSSGPDAAGPSSLGPLRSSSLPSPATPGAYFARAFMAPEPELWNLLLEFVKTASTPVRIAAALCLANVAKAEPYLATKTQSSTNVQVELLDAIVDLFQTVSLEDKIKLCFVVGTMTSDDATVGMASFGIKSHQYMVQVLHTIEQEDEKGNLSRDIACRGREAALLGLASLAFTSEEARVTIAESDPPCLQYLLRALSHPSYGVRAAACQLARALSRTVSLVRTSLTDSGVSAAVIECLCREVTRRQSRSRAQSDVFGDDGGEGDWEDETRPWVDQTRTVEVCALMTLCNLIANFSPLKDTLLAGPCLDIICDLTHSPHEPSAMNALWALKNAMFKSTDSVKARVLAVLGIEHLRTLIAPTTPAKLRIQAFGITQNYLADGTLSDLTKAVDSICEDHLLHSIISATREGTDPELHTSAMRILVNLSWGNEKMRTTLVSRPEIVDALSRGLDSKHNGIKHAALKSLRNLITSTTKSSRPRQAMLDVFQPYQLKVRVKDLADNSRDLDVLAAANGLYEVLEKAKGTGSEVLKEDALDR